MNHSRTATAVLLLLIAAALPGRGQVNSEVDISGTVTDLSGAPLKNAKVILFNQNLTAITDANGKYSLKAQSTSIRPSAGYGLQASSAAWSGNGLVLGVGEARADVQVSLFALGGQKIAEVLRTSLDHGNYRIDPFAGRNTSGIFFLQVRIAGWNRILKINNLADAGRSLSSPASSYSTWQNSSGAASNSALRKIAVAVNDTLSVVAMGYDRGERVVDALTGTQDFKLGAVKLANVLYKTGANLTAAEKSSCILDIHKPATAAANGKGWPVVIHLHGGGMTGGSRNEGFDNSYNHFGDKFLAAGILEVTPGYRLVGSGGTWPDYIRDAAAAAVWVRKNIEPYGGDPNSVFITGFSAGAYLTHMLAIDTTWFGELHFDPHQFAGFVSMSGQTKTHGTIQSDLKVNNIMAEKPYAMPMGHIHKVDLPWQIFVGGDEGNTITDNKAMFDALIAAGSAKLTMDVIPNQPHTCSDLADAVSPKREKFLAFINKYKRN